MAAYFNDPKTGFNAVKAADEAVLALATYKRSREMSPIFLSQAISLCDYLKERISDIRDQTTEKASHRSFRTPNADAKGYLDNEDYTSHLEKAIELLKEILENPSSATADARSEEITHIQELLINLTMPIWRRRTMEFRDKKLKRGLVIDA
jgi:hypothetical protein